MIIINSYIDTKVVDVFKSLFEFLSENEYRLMYIQSLTNGYGLIHVLRTFLQTSTHPAQNLLNLFAVQKKISSEESKKTFPKDFFNELIDKSILLQENDKIFSYFQIIPVNYQFFLLLPYRVHIDPPVYIGADSLSFNRLLQFDSKTIPKNVLDIATGSGYQLFTLPWQSSKTSLIGFDINPNSIMVAELNRKVNSTPWMEFDTLDISNSDGQRDLKNKFLNKFDYIIGNPPIIPTPETLNTRALNKIHVDGGEDGLEIIGSFLPIVPNLLIENGVAQFILSSFGSNNRPSILMTLEKLFKEHNLSGKLIGVKKIPVELDSLYRGYNNLDEYNNWMNFYNQKRASYWYRLILRISNSKNSTGLRFIESYRNDHNIKPEGLNINQILSKIEFSLSKIFPHITDYHDFENKSARIKSYIKNNYQIINENSINEFSNLLFLQFKDFFTSLGIAKRFWGLCLRSDWEPKFLERVKW